MALIGIIVSNAQTGGADHESFTVRKATARDIQTINKLLEMGGNTIYDKKMTVKKLKYLNRVGLNSSGGIYLGFLDGKPVATATIKNLSWGYNSPKLSTTANVIDPEYRGRGLMVKFSRAIFDLLRAAGETSIRSQVEIDNTASRRVMEKLGFVEEKEFENHIFYKLDL